MKIKHFIPFFAMALMGCAGSPEQGIGIKMENMDTSVAPGTDFYQYACGGWIKNNPLKPEYPRFGSFDEVAETNREQIKSLIEDLAAEKHENGSVGQKIGDLYALLMDSVRLNKDGYAPIKNDIERIKAIKDRSEVMPLMAELSIKGSSELFAMYIEADMMDSKKNLVQIYQSGLTLGQKEYYLNDDEAMTKMREAYKKHIVNMFNLIGYSEADAQKKMNSVLSIETRIAKASKNNVELRDPASNYHKISYDDLKKEYTGFDWDKYMSINYITDLKEISVGQPEALKEAIAVLNDAPLDQLKDLLEWKLLTNNSSVLGDKIYAESFDFFGRTMSGAKEPQPRWKRAVSTVNGVLGDAVGEMYVKKYFPAENKERMVQLVKNLQEALAERIDSQEWMSDSTKLYAKEKLAAFYVKIGYPDKWRDYSGLSIDPSKSLYENMQAVGVWANKDVVSRKYNKPVDPDEWHMTPQTVNAYYNPTTNEICFPAGILQYPFFDMKADDAFNYGAIGVVIGHEMTHGFDDQGRQFDKEGNFRNWWASGDDVKFKAIADKMVTFFDSITVLPGLKANGALTLGENLADHGGLQIAYTAFKNATKDKPLPTVNGLTPEQRFFLAYAGVWAQNITEECMRDYTNRDVHSLGEWRVRGALPHIDAWYEAFGITEKDPMFIPKEKRVQIW
ncbi:MAG: peptidase M13 [Bacteroides sp. 43_108]|nr:MAG: peptidase M13 [Bacteroides sp. 43_108]